MKDEYKLTCTIEERTSKAGTNYKVLAIALTQNYKKDVFLDRAEMELLKQNYNDFELKLK